MTVFYPIGTGIIVVVAFVLLIIIVVFIGWCVLSWLYLPYYVRQILVEQHQQSEEMRNQTQEWQKSNMIFNELVTTLQDLNPGIEEPTDEE